MIVTLPVDSGFYRSPVIRFLEACGCGYLTATLDTIRTDLIVLPARLVRESKRNVVKLPHDYHYQREFLDASRKLERLRIPQKFRICK